ncbi:guanylate-binding protein 3-like [Hoplias malabaricus]|uniref:guanylate-binding protein 3-like n=1 Tax=Hoplias malabaricus TaxID=27720 RepID=UPI003461D772
MDVFRTEVRYNRCLLCFPQSEEVLAAYLTEKNKVGSSILVADRSLNEAEQKIQEEKLQKDALEQKNKYLEEHKKIQEQLILDQQKSHEEHVEQLKKKMEAELARNREEIQRTLDAQFKEQMQSIKEEHHAKSLQMQMQIDRIKEERSRQNQDSGGFLGFFFNVAETFFPTFSNMFKQM